ncbi:MAG TPA: gamma-glutamyl-gamma-aminobutyrate hydrolase family protein [Terracidiphilus sp.]|jgi:putative glutamine amidotransferase|nr:gamma-glutamyl-gamma-aminobutyrate hydrolase family protein [Terracidiphilus sp.]
MTVRIAIPEPTSTDPAYNGRSLPQYIAAVQSAGAMATVIPLHERPDRVARLLSQTHGVLLPGSGFDVDPQQYGEERIPACNPADPARTAVDELLLQDAFNLRKPILAICYGIQSLNVWRGGSLIQDLAAQGKTAVNHTPGRTIDEAHVVRIESGSRLAAIARDAAEPLAVNSSHHQAVRVPGDNLKVTAVCPGDDVIEAVELNSPNHFVVGVQWHPERTFAGSALSRGIFASLVQEAESWAQRQASATVASA